MSCSYVPKCGCCLCLIIKRHLLIISFLPLIPWLNFRHITWCQFPSQRGCQHLQYRGIWFHSDFCIKKHAFTRERFFLAFRVTGNMMYATNMPAAFQVFDGINIVLFGYEALRVLDLCERLWAMCCPLLVLVKLLVPAGAREYASTVLSKCFSEILGGILQLMFCVCVPFAYVMLKRRMSVCYMSTVVSA